MSDDQKPNQQSRRVVHLDSQSNAKLAHSFIDRAFQAGGYCVEVKAATRTTEQNDKMWAMLGDIHKGRPVHNGTRMSPDRWKGTFMDALGIEVEYVPKLDGGGFVPVGHKSSRLTISQFSDLIELIYEFAAREGIPLKDPKEPEPPAEEIAA